MPQLTSTNVKNACPRKYQDGQGSLLRVRKPGSKYWFLRLAVDRRRREIEIDGRLRASSADGRTKAFEHRETVASGPEPFAEKRRCDDATFLEAMRSLNLALPQSALDEAVEQLLRDRSAMDRVRANREVHGLLRDGARVEITGGEGERRMVAVRFVDWNRADANDWLAVSEFWIFGEMYNRRADVVLFVNGIPLVLVELKVSHKNVRDAFDGNLRDYRDTVPHLFWFNAFVMLSNGGDTLVGSMFADWGYFAEWKKINSEGEQGVVSLETALRGTCQPQRLLDLVENFVAFMERPGGLVKASAKNGSVYR